MRTKTLLLAAAVAAAGIAAAQAQSNVYSVNVVGYYNIVIPTGTAQQRLKLVTIALKNPLIANPTLNSMVTNCPTGTQAHLWNQATGGWSGATDFDTAFGWADNGDVTIPYGAGFFLKNVGATPITVTFVGEVPQGNLVNTWATTVHPTGSQVPQSGLLKTDLGFNPVNNQVVQQWNVPNPGWNTQNTWIDDPLFPPAAFENGEPTLQVGEALVIRDTGVTSNKQWNRTFSVP
jgi:hypothetical protein